MTNIENCVYLYIHNRIYFHETTFVFLTNPQFLLIIPHFLFQTIFFLKILKPAMNENKKIKMYGPRESSRWRSYWQLPSWKLASLCNIWGMFYEKSNFCIVFHEMEDGWKECVFYKTTIHCGWIASGYSLHNGCLRCRNCASLIWTNRMPLTWEFVLRSQT